MKFIPREEIGRGKLKNFPLGGPGQTPRSYIPIYMYKLESFLVSLGVDKVEDFDKFGVDRLTLTNKMKKVSYNEIFPGYNGSGFFN